MARRTAISRRRAAARASSRLAMLAHAMANTSADDGQQNGAAEARIPAGAARIRIEFLGDRPHADCRALRW
jgi:hypothetical protein